MTPASHGPAAPPPINATVIVPKIEAIVRAFEDLGDDGAHDGCKRVAKEALAEHHRIQQGV